MSLRFVTSGDTRMTTPSGANTIIGDLANINYFLNTPLTPDSTTGVVNKTANVKAHTRRRYSGDNNPVNVSANTREFLYDPGRRNGSALPGNPFILADGTETRSFMYTGDFVDLHAFFVGDAKMDLVLYSQSAAYSIAAADDGD